MSWRLRRQFSLVMTVVLFLVLVGGLYFYFTNPLPTCADNKQNQKELGVDCGGPCAKVCRFETANLIVLWTRVFEITPGNYSAIAYIENPNRQFGLADFDYQFILTSATGAEVARTTGRSFANSKERFIIFSSNITAPAGTVSRAFLEFPSPLTWQRSAKTDLKLEIKRKSFTMEPTPNLVAEAHSGEVKTLNRIPVYVVLSDKNGNAISASATFIDQLPGQGVADIYFTWPVPLSDTPVFFDFYPHPNLLETGSL